MEIHKIDGNFCSITSQCKNNKCFFRQVDVFRYNRQKYNDPKNTEIEKRYGLPVFPEVSLVFYPEVYVDCKSYSEK